MYSFLLLLVACQDPTKAPPTESVGGETGVDSAGDSADSAEPSWTDVDWDQHPAGLVYASSGAIDAAGLARITGDPNVRYVLYQVLLGAASDTDVANVAALAAAGKNVVLQVWFGPGGTWNWSYYSLPNLARNETVQADLFAGIDALIEQLGADNLYGLHILEEDGSYFGLDIDEPGDWTLNRTDVVDGSEDGNPYTNWTYLYNLAGTYPWLGDLPSISRYAADFSAETGLDAASLPDDPYAAGVWDLWRNSRLWAGAHIAVLDHVHDTWGIRRFAWIDQAFWWTAFSATGLSGHVEGIITDNYGGSIYRWHTHGVKSLLLPEAEYLVLGWGTDDEGDRRENLVSAWLAGADGIGFFEGGSATGGYAMDYTSDEAWARNTALYAKLATLPTVLDHGSDVLLVTNNEASGLGATAYDTMTWLGHPDVVHHREAADVVLEDYRVVVQFNATDARQDVSRATYGWPTWGLDSTALSGWVASGGTLVTIFPWIPEGDDSFLVREGLASDTATLTSYTAEHPLLAESSADAQSVLGLDPSYELAVELRSTTVAEGALGDWPELPLGWILPYGEGEIVLIPAQLTNMGVNGEPTQDACEAAWQQYQGDLVRGVVAVRSPGHPVLDELDPDRLGAVWQSEDGRISVELTHDADATVLLDGVSVFE